MSDNTNKPNDGADNIISHVPRVSWRHGVSKKNNKPWDLVIVHFANGLNVSGFVKPWDRDRFFDAINSAPLNSDHLFDSESEDSGGSTNGVNKINVLED